MRRLLVRAGALRYTSIEGKNTELWGLRDRNDPTPSGRLLGTDYTPPSDKGNAVIANTLVSEGFAPLA